MSAEDRTRWDAKYAGRSLPGSIGPAAVFAPFADVFPTAGHALDIACGQGAAAVWLAQRGLQVAGFDVSPVAVEQARAFAQHSG
ncbi:MAG: class I SAM-dependent methyltransferase, partial [Mycobacterium sp.]